MGFASSLAAEEEEELWSFERFRKATWRSQSDDFYIDEMFLLGLGAVWSILDSG